MRLIIELTDEEQSKIRDFVQRVEDNHRKNGDTDRFKDTTRDGFEAMVTGECAELAVCKHLGVDFDYDDVHIGGDDYDIDYQGKKIEVKMVWFSEKNPELRICCDKVFKPFTHAVLVRQIWKNEKFEILGWTTKEHFVGYGTIQQRKYDKMVCLPVNHLTNMESGIM